MRFLRSIGWLLVLISTPAWAFLKMSFSSSRPAEKKWNHSENTKVKTPTSSQPGDRVKVPLPPLKMQMPPSLPSWILFRLSVGLLSVLIHTPAMALSKISLSSMKPRPVIVFITAGLDYKCTYFWVKQSGSVRNTNLSCRLKSLHSGLPISCCAWSLGCSPSCHGFNKQKKSHAEAFTYDHPV